MSVDLLIDTNRYSDFVAGVADVGTTLAHATSIAVPFVVLGELRYGFLHGTRAADNERRLQQFLTSPRVRVLHSDDHTTREYARLCLQLRGQGTPIPTNDVWVAALSLQHNLTLYDRDRHFDALPQLSRL